MPINASASPAATPLKSPTIITAALYDAPPWGWYTANKQVRGLGPGLIENTIKRLDSDVEVRYILASTERTIQLLLSNRADILVTFYDDRLAERAVSLAQNIKHEYQLWSLVESPINSFGDLTNKTIATSQSYKAVHKLNAATVNYVSVTKNLIPILLSKHADGVAALSFSLEYNAKKYGYSKDRFTIIPIKKFPVHFWVNKNSIIMQDIDRWTEAASYMTQEAAEKEFQDLLAQEGDNEKVTAESSRPESKSVIK